MFLKVLGINDFLALILRICHCQHCSHTVAQLLSYWNFSLCGRNNDTESCNCSVPNLARQSEWDYTRLQNIVLRFANLQCNPSPHPTASLAFLPWPVHGQHFVSFFTGSGYYYYTFQTIVLLPLFSPQK
jgi:hypothetical protein